MRNTLTGRLREPSTWAGLMGIFELLKLFAPQYHIELTGLQAGLGAAAVAMREGGAAAP